MENNEYCSYELSKRLKECGFDEPCIAQWACEPDGKPMLVGSTAFVFHNSELKGRDVVAPFLWQAQKWLREKKGVDIDVTLYRAIDCMVEPHKIERSYETRLTKGEAYPIYGNLKYPAYEQALLEGIKAALDLINPEKK